MFIKLYYKLAFILLLLLSILGITWFYGLQLTSDMYQQEVNQTVNRELAKHIVGKYTLIKNKTVDEQALMSLFQQLMHINPNIELYLLDSNGKILAYDTEHLNIVRDEVSIEPIKQFLENKTTSPVYGDNPGNPDTQSIFTATTLYENNHLSGYLYIILDSRIYQAARQQISNSFIIKNSVLALTISIIFFVFFGFIILQFITRRITVLTKLMNHFSSNKNQHEIPEFRSDNLIRDEIDLLGNYYNKMAQQISAQISELKNNDLIRRELFANISHDLRTPLTNLHGYLETVSLKDQQFNSQQRRQYIDVALKQTQRLIIMVQQLFDLAKLDTCEARIEKESFSITELLHDIVQKFQLREDTSDISFKLEFEADNIWTYGDIGMIQRVLDNLIENAIRYTHEHGIISIQVVNNNDQILVSVSDNGSGIPESEVSHIFNRFYRVDKSRNAYNSGLGLAITKRILDLHGSVIQVKSILQKGTTFTFDMPLYSTMLNS